jgi:hypothetical protein
VFDSQPIPVTELSKARVCSRSLARIAGLNHVGGMDACVLCCTGKRKAQCRTRKTKKRIGKKCKERTREGIRGADRSSTEK